MQKKLSFPKSASHKSCDQLRQEHTFEVDSVDGCARGVLSCPVESHEYLQIITKTRLYNFDPLKPHFYTVKQGFIGVYIIFLISALNIDSAGIKLQGDWGEIVALEGSKSPWEAQRATKTSPSVFATFEKASTCAKRTFCWEKSSQKCANMQR